MYSVVYSTVYSVVFSRVYSIMLIVIYRRQGGGVPQGLSQVNQQFLNLGTVYCIEQCTVQCTVHCTLYCSVTYRHVGVQPFIGF